MNDEIREKLSAYLDGALSEMDRRDVEERLARSEELRLELEALRAVSSAVKGLPKQPLPVGFMARLEARRARGESPKRTYYVLPPSYRPLAFALSSAIVALVIWDKQTARTVYEPRPGWDSEVAKVRSAAEAPASVDVSGQIAAADARKADDAPETAKKEEGRKFGALSTFGKHISAPGKPLGFDEGAGASANLLSGAAGMSGGGGLAKSAAPAASAPAAPPAPQPAQVEALDGTKTDSYNARSEEERSAINEKLYQDLEREKKSMGIAKIMDKDAEPEREDTSGREIMTLRASPEPPSVAKRAARSLAATRGAFKAKQSAPLERRPDGIAVKALALRSADALFTAWAAAGLPGKPPEVKFPEQMALFLAGPQGCGITDVQERKKLIVVLYKDAGFDDPAARVRAVPLSPKPAVVKPAP